ncbi:MAG: hypothetical protein HQ543_09290 [Bacteroidetes bacterium]|nr:hypothetical protein [Bacteroidota bacterium]
MRINNDRIIHNDDEYWRIKNPNLFDQGDMILIFNINSINLKRKHQLEKLLNQTHIMLNRLYLSYYVFVNKNKDLWIKPI